jgi:hypothetical protein
VPETLNRERLLAAFDEIGRQAAAAGTRLEIAVYGGSALMLASNFRFSTEEVDVGYLEQPWPEWLVRTLGNLSVKNGWRQDWFNTQWNFI